MSFRPVRKIAGIGNVFLGTELVDIAEYELEIYEENPEDHEHHGANWTPGAKKIEGTVVGELPIRKDLRLLTEEGYSVSFYLRDSFGSVVILDPMLDSNGNLLKDPNGNDILPSPANYDIASYTKFLESGIQAYQNSH